MGVGLFLLASAWSGVEIFEQAGSPPARDGANKTWIEEIEVGHHKQPCKTLDVHFVNPTPVHFGVNNV